MPGGLPWSTVVFTDLSYVTVTMWKDHIFLSKKVNWIIPILISHGRTDKEKSPRKAQKNTEIILKRTKTFRTNWLILYCYQTLYSLETVETIPAHNSHCRIDKHPTFLNGFLKLLSQQEILVIVTHSSCLLLVMRPFASESCSQPYKVFSHKVVHLVFPEDPKR